MKSRLCVTFVSKHSWNRRSQEHCTEYMYSVFRMQLFSTSELFLIVVRAYVVVA